MFVISKTSNGGTRILDVINNNNSKPAAGRKAMKSKKQSKSKKQGKKQSSDSGSGSSDDGDHDRDSDRDSDNGSDDDDDADGGLAAATISALEFLYTKQRITKAEKQLLTADVIQHVNEGSCSKVEIAMTLLIGGFKPGEGAASQMPATFSLVDEEDMTEFEEMCHRQARSIADNA
jgi:hypothetical protein